MTNRPKRTWLFIWPVLASVLLAAHFSRVQNDWMALFCLILPAILLIKKGWALRIFQLYLCIGGFVWIERTLYLRQVRIAAGSPWVRLAIILGAVALFTFFVALLMERRKIRAFYIPIRQEDSPTYIPSFFAFVITGILLAIIQFQVHPPILLLERFLPGTGMIEVFGLAFYAAWITDKMLTSKNTAPLRNRIWLLFSAVFFAQFILGLAGIEKCMMTGRLHLPIPALIIGGPVFRGSGFFMPILFVSTVLLAGAAWCSHLCYIGSWDNLASRHTRKAGSLPRWWSSARVGILFMIILAALGLRWIGVNTRYAGIVAILYGLAGGVIILVISRSNGTMTHCTVYCPIGLVADLIGRINPFRIRFGSECDGCGACRWVCRYNALTETDIQNRRPGISCTLCGDCLPSCGKKALYYTFPRMKPDTARLVFVVLALSFHAVFLGVARI